jgi:Flp pilus assembly protein TadD
MTGMLLLQLDDQGRGQGGKQTYAHQAVDHLAKCVEIQPFSVRCWKSLAKAYKKLGNSDLAKGCKRRAKEVTRLWGPTGLLEHMGAEFEKGAIFSG